MADTKLSQIADGTAFVAATDKVVTVRSGSTDVLTTLAASAATDTTNAANISSGTLPTARIATNVKLGNVGVTLDGGGLVLTTGQKGYVTCPYAGTITAWDITADAGTCTFDVWKIATGTAVPTVSNTITASAKPALATGTAIHSTTLTSWTVAVAAGDIFGFNLDAVATATKITLQIEITKS